MIRLLRVASLLLAVLAVSAQNSEPFKYRIKLTTSSSPADEFHSRLLSALNRELRSLGDVAVVESEPLYELSITALRLKNLGVSSGYALSASTLRHFNLSKPLEVVSRLTVDQFKAAGLPLTDWFDVISYTQLPADVPFYLGTSLYSGGDLDVLSREIIADFDAEVLIPDRKRSQAYGDALDKALRETKKP